MAISNSTDRFNGVVASLAVKVRAVVGVESNVAVLNGISNPYDGVFVAEGDRVLLTAQTDPIENGAWNVFANSPWTRAADWDGNRDVEKGSTIWAGLASMSDKLWQVQTAGVILPGSTAQSITVLLDPNSIGALVGTTVDSTLRYDGVGDFVENLNLLVEADGRVTHPNAVPTRWLDLVAAPVELLDFQEQSLAVSGQGSVVANFEGTDGDRTYTGDDGRVWLFNNSDLDLNEITNSQAAFGLTSYFVGDDGTANDDMITTDIEAEYTAGDFVCGTRDWFVRFWVFIVNSQTGGNDFVAISAVTTGTRAIRWQTNNNVWSIAYADGGGGENVFPTFGASAVDSTWHEIVFERVGNEIFCYDDGVQSGAAFDCTGDDIGIGLTGDARVVVGGSIFNGAFGATPKQDTLIDAFEMRIGANLYGGVAPGSPGGSAPAADAETMLVGDPGYRTRIDGNALNIAGAYDLPVVDGAAGQALVTNGGGTVSFAAASPVGTLVDSMLVYDGAAYVENLNILYREQVDIDGSGSIGNELVILDDDANGFSAITLEGDATNGHLMFDSDLDRMLLFAQNLHISTGSVINMLTNTKIGAVGDGLQIETIGGTSMRLTTDTAGGRDVAILAANGAQDLHLTFGTGLVISEKAAAHVRAAGEGQFWVRNDVANVPMFTDDAGVDFNLLEANSTGSSIISPYRFSTSIVEADPGAGTMRYDNATPASVTELFIDQLTDEGNDLQNILSFIAAGDRIYVQQDNDSTRYLLMTVTANVDNTGWFSIAGTTTNSGTLPANNAKCHIMILFGAAAGGGAGPTFVINADINTATPPTTEIPVAEIEFRDLADDDLLGTVGFGGNNDMVISNEMHGGELFLRTQDAGGVIRTGLELAASTILRSTGNLQLVVNNTEEALLAIANGLTSISHNNIAMARTAIAASGGLQVNNTVTGAGFERVLTTSDLGGGGTFAALTDTDVAGVADHDMLFFDTAAGDWKDTGGLIQADVDGAIVGIIINDAVGGKDGSLLIQNGASVLQGLSLSTDAANNICIISTPILGNTELWLVAENGGSDIVMKADRVLIAGGIPSVEFVSFQDDDVDFNTVASGKTDWNISGFSGAIRIAGMDMGFGDDDILMFGTGDDTTMTFDGTNFVFDTAGLATFLNGSTIFGNPADNVAHVIAVVNSIGAARFLVANATGQARISQLSTALAAEDEWIIMNRNGSVILHNNNVSEIQTQDNTATGTNSGGQVKDGAGNFHDLGFNDLVPFNDNVSDTLEAGHEGQVAFKDATTARTLTLAAVGDLDFGVHKMTTVINAFATGDYTITEGASTTLFFLDGSTVVDTAGGLTVGPGGVCNIWREAAGIYYAWGTGITP